MSLPADTLKKHWGYDGFRPLQEEAVGSALNERDAMVILPTGGGKSICYQLPAVHRGDLTLVISPLIALMDDQVMAAQEVGLKALALHSNLGERARKAAWAQLHDEDLHLLYVSPERLSLGDLLDRVAPRLGLVAIDEAHCVSHWGHDFRPVYRQLLDVLQRVPKVPRMALTATATEQVQRDICVQLGLRDPLKLVGHVDRPNLIYRSIPRQNAMAQIQEVIDRHEGEGGIVYCQTRKSVERVAEKLRMAGVNAAAYHAGLSATERARVQEGFLRESIQVVAATIAFGMGIDRSNVRFVVHHNAPKSLEHYQQEAGRAGRDGLPADCVLLYNYSDIATHRSLAMNEGPMSTSRKAVLEKQLKEVSSYASSPICRHRLLVEHFDQAWDSNVVDCGACDVCLGETRTLGQEESLVAAQKILSAVYRCRNRFGITHVVNVLMGRRDQKVVRNDHHNLSVHGIMKEDGEVSIRTWVDQLIQLGHLVLDESEGFPLLAITPSGIALCKEGGELRLSQVNASVKKAPSKKEAVDWQGVDGDLFKALRDLRKRLADDVGKPPYVVFSDATLRELAREKPLSDPAFLAIKGVGEAKLKRYGAVFMELIRGEAQA